MQPRQQVLLAAAIIISGWLMQWFVVEGLIAYDCEDQNTDITAVSLKDIAKCPEPKSAYASEPIVARVIQRQEVNLQHVWSCLVEITRLISHCGMHSHSSMVAGGLSSYVHQVGAEQCRTIHQTRVLQIHQHTIGQLILNGTTSTSLTLLGHVDNSGNCKGVYYYENGRSWQDVIVTATVRVQLNDYQASVRLKENEVSLKGGITCPFLKGYCFDSTLGETVWEIVNQDTCEGTLSMLYAGLAEKVVYSKTEEQYIVVEQDTKIFAVMLIKKVTVCNLELWQTEHPRLLVSTNREQIFQPPTVIIPQDVDLMAYINSKFLYIEQSNKRNLESLYIDTIHRRCLLHRQILKNRLLLAPVVPDAVSQIIQHQEGYIGHVLGEVLYILRCVPKQVRIRRVNSCYHELPVEVDNKTKFMAPITRILQNHGEEIDCNGLTPPLYYIDGEWVGLAPHPTVKKPPKELEVGEDPGLQFRPIQPLGSRGLYTQEEISQVQRLMTFGTERKVVENIIARRISGMEAGNQGFSTLGLFNPAEMKDLAYTTMRQIWGWFTDLGIFMSGVIGFYVIFRLIKYILGVIINGLQLYQTVGGGIAMVACLWNTLTMWVLHSHQVKNVNKGLPEPIASVNNELYPDCNRLSAVSLDIA